MFDFKYSLFYLQLILLLIRKIMDFQMLKISSNELIESMSMEGQFFQVYIRLHNGNGTLIKVHQTTTLSLFKILIAQSSLALNEQYQLIFEGKVLRQLQKPLMEYGIKQLSVIHVESKCKSPNKFKIDVSIFYNKESFYISILTSQTVYDLNQKIYRLLEIHPNNQKLIFQGTILQQKKMIEHYNIKNDSLISLIAKKKSQKLNLKEINSNQVLLGPRLLLKNTASTRNASTKKNEKFKKIQSCMLKRLIGQSGYEIQIKQKKLDMNLCDEKQFNYELFNKMFEIKGISGLESDLKLMTLATQHSEGWTISEGSSQDAECFKIKQYQKSQVSQEPF